MAKTNKTHIKQVADKAHDAIDKAADMAEKAENKAYEASDSAKLKAEETIETVKGAGEKAQSSVQTYVNENPLKAVGIAFGAGVLASVLLRK